MLVFFCGENGVKVSKKREKEKKKNNLGKHGDLCNSRGVAEMKLCFELVVCKISKGLGVNDINRLNLWGKVPRN